MTNELKIFDYNDKMIRTVTVDNEPWWILKDVCETLGLTDTNKVSERLDNDELTRIKIVSGNQSREMLCVNESGLYAAIIRSNKKEAKQFRKWITSEVLPSIRKTGSYSIGETTPNSIKTDTIQELLQIQQQQITLIRQEQHEAIQQQFNAITVLTNLITSTLPRQYKPPFTRWMTKTFANVDIIAEDREQTRKQTLHQLYSELQNTYDIDLHEHTEEYCYAHGLQNTGIYTLNAIGADAQLKQLFDIMVDNYIPQPCTVGI